jgi:hypothetical protein
MIIIKEICNKKRCNKIQFLLKSKIKLFCKSQNTIYKTIIILLSVAMVFNILSEFSFMSTILLGVSLLASTYLLKITKVKL